MPSDDWIPLSERVLLVPGAVNAVVVLAPDGAVAIDSGAGKEAGKKLLRGLSERGVRLRALVTTHAHADHFGGHAAILRAERVPVYAPPVEAELMRAPILEPIYLFHGAVPLPELTGRWLQAEPSPVDQVVDAGTLDVAGIRLTLVDVSGHAYRQLAVLVDDVLVAADGVFGDTVIARYPMLFTHDARAQRHAALVVGEAAAREGVRVTVPGHGSPGDGGALAAATVAAIDRVREQVAEAADGVSAATVLARVTRALGCAMDDLPRYHLNHTTVMAYLAGLRADGVVEARLERGELLWGAPIGRVAST
jgi:glyoxylase-like metal-dependent hydrolase (beta-lactamase superfamily II)